MRFFYPDTPDLPLPPGHRFPAVKYRMLRQAIADERVLGDAALLPSPRASREELARAHDPEYVDAVMAGTLDAAMQRRIGLPWSPTLVERSCAAVGGSLAAARAALRDGLSGQLAGGTHHAHRDFGSGYCVFNDLAVAALTLLEERAVQRIAILDCDVHQGDGTAAILAGRDDVLVISLHGAKNFPFRRVSSTIDIDLPDGTDDAAYLTALDGVLPAVADFGPDLLLYLSGADAYAGDALGRLSLTFDGLFRRDRSVFDFCRRRQLPVSIAVGGGYARNIEETVHVYVNTFRAAMAARRDRP